ncbi:MAG: LPS assembly lipoprotein LptE [Desulfurobacteriaceae bacterium]
MRVLSFLLLFFTLFSCASTKNLPPSKVEHIYLEPVVNRTGEEGLDVIFSKVANEVFYSDSRFKVEKFPTKGVTLLVKPTVNSISTFAVGFDRYDRAVEYRMTITATVKLVRYGFTKSIYTFKITRYDFYDATGTPEEIETRRKECIERIAYDIFREVGERILVKGREIESSPKL